MSVLVKISVLTTATALLVATGTAHAEVDPDYSYSGFDLFPTSRTSICLNGNCSNPYIYAATQDHDCNKAGTATPVPLFGKSDPLFDLLFDLDPMDESQWQFRTPDIPSEDDEPEVEDRQGLIFPSEDLGLGSFPMNGSPYTENGADQDPMKFTFGESASFGNIEFGVGYSNNHLLNSERLGSYNVETPLGGFPAELQDYSINQMTFQGTMFSTIMVDEWHVGDVILALEKAGISDYQYDVCRKVLIPTDPNYRRSGRHGGNSWGEQEDDQWAIKRVGFTDDDSSAWNLVPDNAASVVVAVIDTGLDWHHLDINAENIWRNPAEIPDNGIDDDNNGYVDDIIGWDFLANSNKPWDFDGHGTVVTGIIAAAHNDVGIAGINPRVKIMVLKAVNNFGTTRASFLANAIVYAVDNGAQVINISVGGPHESRIERAAIEYAHQAGVLIVAAAGNEGIELDDFGPGGNDKVLTVGATFVDDRAAAFSNFGNKVDLVAPGVDVLSLRARYTDANFRPDADEGGEYAVGDNYVGTDKRYLHVSGTSFSTPIVAGIASLMLSKNPALTADEVRRVLLQTATDVEFPGKDKYTGHGMVNAQVALGVEPDFSVTAKITKVEALPADAPQFVRVTGTIDATGFKRAWMQIGAGENPGGWRYVGPKRKYPIHNGELGTIPIRQFSGSDLWQVVINVEHKNGVVKKAVLPITLH